MLKLFGTVMSLLLLAVLPVQAVTADQPIFVWGAEPTVIVSVDTCMLSTPQEDNNYIFCEMDEVIRSGFGTVMVGYDRVGFRLFLRFFEASAFAATDIYPDERGGLGRRDEVESRVRTEHGLPYDASVTCALYGTLSFITHECVLNAGSFPATRFFLGNHPSYLYISTRVVGHGWAAAWINKAGEYGFNGQLTSLP